MKIPISEILKIGKSEKNATKNPQFQEHISLTKFTSTQKLMNNLKNN